MRSAKRWEKEEGLPVHRHLHGKRDSVYAYRGELDDWWVSRGSRVADRNGEEDAEAAPSPAEPEPPSGDTEATQRDLEAKVARPAPRPPRRAALIGVGFLLAVLVVSVVAWLSRNGSPPREGTLPAEPFEARDWVLVAGFDNRTGEPLFDGTLDYALGVELSNSRRVNVVPRERVADSLRLMRRPLDSPIDAGLAREVCLRDGGIRALLTGRVEKLGSTYVLSVELIDPKDGRTLAGFREQSSGTDASLAAIQRISDRVRIALGETPAGVEPGKTGLAKVTTTSLRALQLYSQADLLMRLPVPREPQAAAEELLRQAVAEDPTFASAWILLAFTLRNQGKPPAAVRECAETALRLADSTTERERYFIRGSYYALLGQREKAIPAYEALLARHPDHLWAANNLRFLYDWQHDPRHLEKAIELEVRLADSRPKDFFWSWNVVEDFVAIRPDPARSATYARRASALITPEVREGFPVQVGWMDLLPFTRYWLEGDLKNAAREIDRVASTIDPLAGPPRDYLALQTALGYLTLGQLDAARKTSDQIFDSVIRNDMLAQIAFIQGDHVALRRYLRSQGNRMDTEEWWWDTALILQAREGLTSDARRFVEAQGKSEPAMNSTMDLDAHTVRGEIALAGGHPEDGIRELEQAWKLHGERPYVPPAFYLGRESLAAVLARRGDVARAIEILEGRPERVYAAGRGTTAAYWLRNRLQLAGLYRRVGRVDEARTVEAELTELLALADPDHPILLELQRLPRT